MFHATGMCSRLEFEPIISPLMHLNLTIAPDSQSAPVLIGLLILLLKHYAMVHFEQYHHLQRLKLLTVHAQLIRMGLSLISPGLITCAFFNAGLLPDPSRIAA